MIGTGVITHESIKRQRIIKNSEVIYILCSRFNSVFNKGEKGQGASYVAFKQCI